VSPDRDVEGKRAKGWATYTLADASLLDESYERVRKIVPWFSEKSYFYSVVNYIKSNPEEEFEGNSLSERLKIHPQNTSTILSLLARVGALKPESGFSGGFSGKATHSRARANENTKLLEELVILPSREIARELEPLHRPTTREAIATLMENYERERTHRGSEGGELTRDIALEVLGEVGDWMKLSLIAEKGNERLRVEDGRELGRVSWKSQLDALVSKGKIERDMERKGFYRIRIRN
jgi:hypothetical protein